MPIRKSMVGTGITKREVTSFHHAPDAAMTKEEWRLTAEGSRGDNRRNTDISITLDDIEAQATATLEAAKLPARGMFDVKSDGTRRKVNQEERFAEGDMEPEPGVMMIDGSRFRSASWIVENAGFAVDSREGYAVGFIALIDSIRSSLKAAQDSKYSAAVRGQWASRAAVSAMRLGALVEQAEIKNKWEPHAIRGEKQKGGTGRPKTDDTDECIALARRFIVRRAEIKKRGGTGSDTFIKECIGKEADLGRTTSIRKINRGLKLLSGE